MDRRSFLKSTGIAAGACLTAQPLKASTPRDVDPVAVLVDTTLCAGCRRCERACAKANDLPLPDRKDDSVFETRRRSSETQWTVVNRFETDEGELFAKRQCMHCRQPACASACLTKAMEKTKEGPVVWREEKCMGCRYCMLSCPFDGPAFEYDSANPRIQKCRMCWERLERGKEPACVRACPQDALTFGRRAELLKEAHRRIQESPDEYVDHVYGEHEAGGTNWLYLASVPFEQLGFRVDLGTTPFPEYTRGFLYSVPTVLTLWPLFLLGLSRARGPGGGGTPPGGAG